MNFTVSLLDSGPSGATGVVISDALPAGLQFVSATPDTGTYETATGTWAVGTVAAGPTTRLRISAKVTSPAAQTNVAAITHSDQFGPETGNDSDGSIVRPQLADLVVAKSVDDPRPNVGQTVFFTVSLRNAEPQTATGATLADSLPAGLQFVAATPGRGIYDPVTGSGR